MTGLQNGSNPSRADYDLRGFARALRKKQFDTGRALRPLAEEIGVTLSDFSRAMGGQHVSVGKVIALCHWLGVPVEHFYIEPDPSMKTTCFTGSTVKRPEART